MKQMTEIPPAEYSRDKGIRGLMQIATQSRDKNALPARIEIVNRYFAKFKARMIKQGTPLTQVSEDEITSILNEIIHREV
jgi:hypothetical protein